MPKIVVLPGDGVGPEVTDCAVAVLTRISQERDRDFTFQYDLVGGAAIDRYGVPLREETLDLCRCSDAVLLGAVGGPQWDSTDPTAPHPEEALLGLRKGLGLFANLRPVRLFPDLIAASPLKKEVVEGTDIVVVRELTGDVYFGEKGREKKNSSEVAFDTMIYSREEVERIVRVAFDIARKRNKRLTSVDKANILESSRLWREVTNAVAQEYPQVKLVHLYVDNAAMQLVLNPRQFDVVVTSNLFGDILSDEAAILTGSIGMLPSASLGGKMFGLYEPVHGSAPDLAGKDVANPIAAILSAALMLRFSFDLDHEARVIEQAVEKIIEKGYRTQDIYTPGTTLVGTREACSLVIENMNLP
ncbi:MAG: 3-isopropylmalate dehydrogenase [Actinobacteria bacterium]|nr:3-isopropylmalate dehydrogenase [Actinomycetota bacterium]